MTNQMTIDEHVINPDDAWAKEAEERIDAYERGLLSSVPAQAVFDRLDKLAES